MTTNPVTTCDVCGTAKKETNNWFRAWIADGKLVFAHAAIEFEDPAMRDICGQECAGKLLQGWLTTGKLEAA